MILSNIFEFYIANFKAIAPPQSYPINTGFLI